MDEFQQAKPPVESAEEEAVKPAAKKTTKAAKVKPQTDESEDVESSEYNPADQIGDLLELRKYQLSDKAKAVRKHLASQGLIRVLVPRMEGESKDAIHPFIISGFDFAVRKGVYQNVPEDVADMIRDNYGQDAQLVADHPLNLKNNSAAAKEFSR